MLCQVLEIIRMKQKEKCQTTQFYDSVKGTLTLWVNEQMRKLRDKQLAQNLTSRTGLRPG